MFINIKGKSDTHSRTLEDCSDCLFKKSNFCSLLKLYEKIPYTTPCYALENVELLTSQLEGRKNAILENRDNVIDENIVAYQVINNVVNKVPLLPMLRYNNYFKVGEKIRLLIRFGKYKSPRWRTSRITSIENDIIKLVVHGWDIIDSNNADIYSRSYGILKESEFYYFMENCNLIHDWTKDISNQELKDNIINSFTTYRSDQI